MNKVKPIQKQLDPDCDMYDLNSSDKTGAPDKAMYRAQGAARLERPLKSDGTSDAV